MSTGSSRTSTCPVRRLPPRGGRRGARPAVGGHRLRPTRSRVVDPPRRPPRRGADEPFRAAATAPGLHSAFDRLVGAGRWVPRTGLGTWPVRSPRRRPGRRRLSHQGERRRSDRGDALRPRVPRARAADALPVLRHGRTRRLHSDQGRFAPRPADPRRRHRRHPPTRSTGERGSSPGEQAMRAAPRLWTRRAFRTFPAQPDLLSGRVRPCGIVRAA
jgi:hypothetical protein